MDTILKSFITSYSNEDDLKNKISILGDNCIKIEIDGKIIGNKIDLFELFYKNINAPLSFGRNWAAFWDTISDQEFWIKNNLILILKNKNDLFFNENDTSSLNSLYDILIDLLDLDGYFIFINK